MKMVMYYVVYANPNKDDGTVSYRLGPFDSYWKAQDERDKEFRYANKDNYDIVSAELEVQYS